MGSQPVRQSETPVVPPSADDLTESGGVLPAWRFRLAVLLHDRAVYRLAAALLRDAREAEDVTQEVFLSYWQHGVSVERPREWLLRVARNAAFGRLRKSGRFVNHTPDEMPEVAVFINLVGAIRPEQLGRVAAQIGMDGMFSMVPGVQNAPTKAPQAQE